MKKLSSSAALAALALGAANAATVVSNQLINIDFGTAGSGGVGADPNPGHFAGDLEIGNVSTATEESVNWIDSVAGNDFWNGDGTATNDSIVGLLDSTGATTGVNVSWSGFGFSYDNYFNGRSGNLPSNGPNGDGIFTSNNNVDIGTVTFSGLVPGGLYNLTYISAFDASELTINGGTPVTVGGFGPSSGQQFWEFTNVTATGGSITLTLDGERSDSLGGLQLNQVPEPSSTLLVGLAGLGLLVRRRA